MVLHSVKRLIPVISRFVFGTCTIKSFRTQNLLPEVKYSTMEFGMECLEEENYKFPVKVLRSSCNLGLHTQPTFMFTKITDGVISGDGRVLDHKRRLVEESVPTHHRGAVNPGFLRTRKCKVSKGSALALNW
jgi:hypothetical protein